MLWLRILTSFWYNWHQGYNLDAFPSFKDGIVCIHIKQPFTVPSIKWISLQFERNPNSVPTNVIVTVQNINVQFFHDARFNYHIISLFRLLSVYLEFMRGILISKFYQLVELDVLPLQLRQISLHRYCRELCLHC